MAAETLVLLLHAERIGHTSHLPLELVVRTKYNNYIKLLVKQSRHLSSCVYFFLIVSFACLRAFGLRSKKTLCRFFHPLRVRIPFPRLPPCACPKSGPYSLHLMLDIYVLPLSVLRIVMGRMYLFSWGYCKSIIINLILSPLCFWTCLCILHIHSDSDLYSKF